MSTVVPIVPGAGRSSDPKLQAFLDYFAKSLGEFAAANGPPSSIALVLMGDISQPPLCYHVASWTPGDSQPPKVVVQSFAAALLQASVAAKVIDSQT